MIGIDAGTFHTVAVESTEGQIRLPKRSIPSIARKIGNSLQAGWDERLVRDIPSELILAPKLRLADAKEDRSMLQDIIEILVRQALEDLLDAGIGEEAVVTVPPGWNFDQCEILKQAIGNRISDVRFIHEPVALILAALYLAPQYHTDPRLVARLDSCDHFLICDWGAGTVDLALISIRRHGTRYEFSCLHEHTDSVHGGTAIARDAVRNHRIMAGGNATISEDEEALLLQSHWEGESLGLDSSRYDPHVEKRRRLAADAVAEKIAGLVGSLDAEDAETLLGVLHGGPLESEELRKYVTERVHDMTGMAGTRFVHIGNGFASQLPHDGIPWRRDVLVAAGASLFGLKGKALPEFEYDVVLRDARGQPSNPVRLAIRPGLAGRQTIQPPFTDSDYYVEVRQMRRDANNKLVPTAVTRDLALYVRENALLRYSVSEAGVGYARVEVAEVTNSLAPERFGDSRSATVDLPERSTRFSMDMN